MSYGGVAGVTAATAAARRRQMMLEREEEEMTPYTQDDLDNDWEFKIVRAGTPVFRKREVLERLVEEETRAGWIMLEKLDDQRIRFKRPRRARAQDAYLPSGVDPYRTHYGALSTRQVMIVLLVVGLALFFAGLLAFGSRLR
jgi:hypothetical protein